MAKKKGKTPTDNNSSERLGTSPEDRVKAEKWFRLAKELGGKRQFDYAIEYYVNGLEFWPDAVEDRFRTMKQPVQLLNFAIDGGGLANWWSTLIRLVKQ